MSLVQLLDIFYRRQRRVFLLVTVAVMLAATAATLSLEKQYQATSTLIVGENRPISAGSSAVMLDDVLARTYSNSLESAATQRAVSAELPGVSADELDQKVSVEVVPGTRLLEIVALDAQPDRAQAMANTYAETFVDEQQASLTRATSQRRERLTRQIGELADQLEQVEAGGPEGAAGRRAQIEFQLNALRQSLQTIQENDTLQGQNVSLQSLAVLPSVPAKPRTKLLLAMAFLMALLLGAAAALIRNTFDRRIRNEEELSELLGGLPILARIPDRGADREQRALNEAFDFLRVNLQLSAADRPARVIAVTSSLPGDGKSTICQRLSRAYAQQGADVVAMDCDLRKPMLATYMHVNRHQGVTNVLVTGASPLDMLVESEVRGVRLLPSGPVPPNPSVLLGLPRFREIVEEVRRMSDYVIVDTPPVPAGVDTSAISQVVDGVVLVIDLDRSDRSILEVTRDQLEKANARVLGIVLNRVPDRLAHYGYGTDYSNGSPVEGGRSTAPPPRAAAAPARSR